jgi:hypothetical protein
MHRNLPGPSEFSAPRRGRPRKFNRPSHAVTLTLPDNVIAALGDVDHDLSRAIVRMSQGKLAHGPRPPAELATFGRRAVIVVNPTRTLEQRAGVMLVPLSDGRALIAFDETMTPARLELKIQDALEDHTLPPDDVEIFDAIRELLKKARRSQTVTLRQQNIIVLEFSRRPGKRRTRSEME